MPHHTDTLTIVGARETKHTTHVVELHWIVKEILCHELGAQGVACHDDRLGYVTEFRPDVGSGKFCHNISF